MCDDILERERNRIYGRIDDNWFLERNEEDIYLRVDPMLKKVSLWLQVDHDQAQGLNLHDHFPKDCTSSLGKAFSFHVFQRKVESNHAHVRNQFLSEGEYYNELWLFGKESWISI